MSVAGEQKASIPFNIQYVIETGKAWTGKIKILQFVDRATWKQFVDNTRVPDCKAASW